MNVYLSRPVKLFSGSRQPLEDLALEGFEALLASGGPPPELILLTSAHPFELAGVRGTDLALAVARRAHEFGLSTQVEFYANPAIEESTAHLAASAAGASLVHEAARRVARGEVSRIAVLGLEQMRLTERERTTESLRGLIHPEERTTGLTMPALGALLTRRFESRFPALQKALTALTIANRSRTAANPRAHMRKTIRMEEIVGERNPIVSDPLRLFDVAPTSSGYAGLFLSNEPSIRETQVVIAGIGRGLDLLSVARRFGPEASPDSTCSHATREAMDEMLTHLGWTSSEFRNRVAFAEIHDAFPIIEFLGLLDSGIAGPETIVQDILSGAFEPTGRLPVNVMGGVMGGHPIGATGVGQIVELYLQALGRAEMKVPVTGSGPRYAFALNVGGPLTYNCVTLLCAHDSREKAPDFRLSVREHATAGDIDVTAPAVLRPGPARVVSGTRLEFPPIGYQAPCHIALVSSPDGTQFVASLRELTPPGSIVDLIQTNGHLSASPAITG